MRRRLGRLHRRVDPGAKVTPDSPVDDAFRNRVEYLCGDWMPHPPGKRWVVSLVREIRRIKDLYEGVDKG